MNNLSELEQRISAALERIGRGTESLTNGDAAVADTEALEKAKDELEAERMVNAQLEERVRAIREKQENQVKTLEEKVVALAARAEGLETELGGLRQVNAELRANNTALREANAAGLADAHLLNKSMQAELEALRRVREGDRAELDDILQSLKPLYSEAANA